MDPACYRSASTVMDQSACHLLRLPAELRFAIFENLFQGAHLVLSSHNHRGPKLKGPGLWPRNIHVRIFGTCKQVYQEASPLFWSMLHVLIEAQTIFQSRNDGIWTRVSLAKIASIRHRIENIIIDFGLPPVSPRAPGHSEQQFMITVLSSFASDLGHYSSLKTCTMAQLLTFDLPGPASGEDSIPKFYENFRLDLVERNREPPWCVQDFQKHKSLQDGLRLLLSRRFDPFNQRFVSNEHGEIVHDPRTSMTFDVYLLACINIQETCGADPDGDHGDAEGSDHVWPRLVLRSKVTEVNNFYCHLEEETILFAEWAQPPKSRFRHGTSNNESVWSMYQDVALCVGRQSVHP